MPRYRPLPENAEVVDVLCSVILHYDNVSSIMKILKEPQSTVSEKLRFLKKNRVISKNKWEFEVNWDELLKLLRSLVKKELIGLSKKHLKLFDGRLKRIMEVYSAMVIELGHKPKSLRDIVWMYLLGVCQTDNKELEKADKGFVKLKKELMAMSEERYLFMTSEDKDD